MRKNIDDYSYFKEEMGGVSKKAWLTDGKSLFLNKYEQLREDNTSIFNDCAEVISYHISKMIGIPCAECMLVTRNGTKGIISKNFLSNNISGPKEEELILGDILIKAISNDFESKKMINTKTNERYTIELILSSVKNYNIVSDVLNMMIFDSIIAHYDRNPSNWGIINNLKTKKYRFSPLFDNATSLGFSLPDVALNEFIIEVDGKPTIINDFGLNEFINKKIKSKIIISNDYMASKYTLEQLNFITSKRKFNYTRIAHSYIVDYIFDNYYPQVEDFINNIIKVLTTDNVNQLLLTFKDEVDLSHLAFAREIILSRVEYIKSRQSAMLMNKGLAI